MPTETLGSWLSQRMKVRGLSDSQVGIYIGRSGATVGRWKRNEIVPNPESCAKLAELFKEPVEKVYGLAGHPTTYETQPERIRPFNERLREATAELLADQPVAIPIHEQTASAGLGDEILDYVYWDPGQVAGRNLIAMRVHGNSMEPKIEDGDVIIVHWGASAHPGQIVVASFAGSVFVKRLEQRDGLRWLVGNTPEMDATRAKIEGVVLKIQKDA